MSSVDVGEGNSTGHAASLSVWQSLILSALKIHESVFVFITVLLVACMPNELAFNIIMTLTQ